MQDSEELETCWAVERTGSVNFRVQRKRSTKSHEITLNYFVLFGVISWIVLPDLREEAH